MTCENLDKCLEAFSQYVLVSESPYYTKEVKNEKLKLLHKCFDSNYPNLYETLKIKIYTMPSDGKTTCEYLPDNERIQASYETYLRENYPPKTPKESDEFNMKKNLYHLLLHNRFRKIYNTYYAERQNTQIKTTVSFGKFVRLYKKLGFTQKKAIKKYNLFHFGSTNIN
jgi:hypothetical protein